jgi:hypothetical protein
MHQPFPLRGPKKFTQIGIFGLKIYTINPGSETKNLISASFSQRG